MRHRVLTFAALVLAWFAGGSSSFAQLTRVPAGLELVLASNEASQGTAISVTVRLLNYKSEGVIGPRPVDVTIESNLLARSLRVTIPAGAESTNGTIVFDRPGVAKLRASASGLSDAFAVVAVKSGSPRARWETLLDRLTAGVQQFYPRLSAARSENPCTTDEPGRSAEVALTMVPPRAVAHAGRWSAGLHVTLLDGRGEPRVALDDVEVSVSPELGVVESERIVIPKGQMTQEVRVTSTAAGCDTIYVWSPAVHGVLSTSVDYEQSRPAKLIVAPVGQDAVANGWTNIPIAVLLKDADNHVVSNPDKDLRVFLRSSLGTLSKTAVTVASGEPNSDEALLSSRRRGTATITATAEGLSGDAEFVSFTLPWLLIPLSIAGGLVGTIVRSSRRRRPATFVRDLAIGGVLGFVLFGFALFGVPILVPALSTDALANLTLNEIGSVLIGFLGGYLGRRYLNRFTSDLRPRQDAVAT